MSVGATPVALTAVLGRVGAELNHLHTQSEVLQNLLSDVVRSAQGAFGDMISLQQIDQVTQHLEGLSAFIRDLGHQIEPDWNVRPDQAAATLTLADQARRLLGQETVPEDSSELILF